MMKSAAQKFLNWEWLLLLILLPAVLFLDQYSSLLLLAIPIFWLGRKVATGRFLPTTPFNLSIVIFMAVVCLSTTAIFDQQLSNPRISNILIGVALFFGSVYFSRNQPRGIWYLLAFVMLTGSMIALVGLAGNVWTQPFTVLNLIRDTLPQPLTEIPGTVGGIVNANELAGTLCWIVPLMLAYLIGQGRHLLAANKPLFFLLLISSALTTFVLLATFSRGGILGFAIALTVIMALYLQPRWQLVLVVGLIVVALGLLIAFQNSQLEAQHVNDPVGITSRLEIWNRALLAISDFPLTGLSVNGFRQVVHIMYPLFTISPTVDIAHAHNHLLQTALDLGIPGLISYLSLWFVAIGLLFQTWRYLFKRKRIDDPYYALVTGLIGSLISGWLFGLFDAVALSARPAFIWWLLLALITSTHYAVIVFGTKRRHHKRIRGYDSQDEITMNDLLKSMPDGYPKS
jgi:putative inorganic carbon (hco3(-)) transporter